MDGLVGDVKSSDLSADFCGFASDSIDFCSVGDMIFTAFNALFMLTGTTR